jgi:uncharacterized integral membrane protein (TIGR00698 family)
MVPHAGQCSLMVAVARRANLAPLLFWALAAICLAPFLPLPPALMSLVAPTALLSGMALALTVTNPYGPFCKKYSRVLLQTAVVLLGFSLNLGQVIQAGMRGFGFSCISILMVFGLASVLQRMLKVRPMTSLLVSAGTAICGGSAIAAMSTAVDAPQEDVTVSVGTIFLLNAVGLLIFPPIGHLLHLTNSQFGTWAGIAIHDVASVVGAATTFGAGSVAIASAVKLSRVLFLIPVTMFFAWRCAGAKKLTIPWFIALFLLASLISTSIPATAALVPWAKTIASSGFALSLFFIGAGLSRQTLRSVGFRPMLEGVILWVFISTISLFAVMTF